ncbi:MAG: type II/IV secretion system protein, partial [Verrucomicrobiota bacterium]|nr:type II/IV secretion system protein [Verrucomicrobiota bacterium]
MTQNEDYILEILVENGLITKSQVERAQESGQRNGSVVDTLIDQGVITREDQMRALAAHASMEFVDLTQVALADDVLEMVPRDVARRFKVVPVAVSDSGLMIAV